MPRKPMPKVGANKVIEILETVVTNMEAVVSALNEKKYDVALQEAVATMTHIEGVKQGIDLIVASPAPNGNGD